MLFQCKFQDDQTSEILHITTCRERRAATHAARLLVIQGGRFHTGPLDMGQEVICAGVDRYILGGFPTHLLWLWSTARLAAHGLCYHQVIHLGPWSYPPTLCL